MTSIRVLCNILVSIHCAWSRTRYINTVENITIFEVISNRNKTCSTTLGYNRLCDIDSRLYIIKDDLFLLRIFRYYCIYRGIERDSRWSHNINVAALGVNNGACRNWLDWVINHNNNNGSNNMKLLLLLTVNNSKNDFIVWRKLDIIF